MNNNRTKPACFILRVVRSALIIRTMKNEYYEYRDRDWEMWLEGSSDDKPNESEIIEHAKSKGFELKNIEIWFDNLQKFWRFNADLIRH